MLEKLTQFLNNFLPPKIFQIEFWSNTAQDYLAATLVLVAFLILFKIFQSIVLLKLKRLAKKTKTDIDDAFVEIIRSVRPPFYFFLAFYLAIKLLTINTWGQKIISAVLVVWAVYLVINAIQILINYVAAKGLSKDEDKESKAAIQAVSLLSKIVLWSLGLLLILSNLGIDITSLIAGLGIGGIAIALALQNILGDLFSSFAIYFDKPFVVGDFIMIGDKKGTVEKIGIKTTRIRSVTGEEVIISNKELTSAQIQNFRRMIERRITFTLGVIYGTDIKKLEEIPAMIKEIVGSVKNVRLDRVHFTRFEDSALVFDIVYYVNSREYQDYMDAQQDINLKIKETFDKAKIEFAYPTQTVYLER